MKIIPLNKGEFKNKVVFNDGEIDSLMELLYFEFWNKSLDMAMPEIDFDIFMDDFMVRKGIEFDPEAEELPSDILGRTCFNNDGTALIQINKSLYARRSDSNYKGRVNFTIAHEVFHALYHRPLFGNKANSTIECLQRDLFKPQARYTPYYEIQANRGAAALILPKEVFVHHFLKERNAYGINSNSVLLDTPRYFNNVVSYLSKLFGASKVAVKRRLSDLGCLRVSEFEQSDNKIYSVGDILMGRGWEN